MKRIITLLCLTLIAFVLCSCADKPESAVTRAIDFTDYTAEEVIAWAVENDVPQLFSFVYTADSDKVSGTVASQSVKSGSPITDGIEITVAVKPLLAADANTVTIPNIIGKSLTDAKAELAKLTIDTEYRDSDKPKDTVISSYPLPGMSVAEGDKILLTLSSGAKRDSRLSVDLELDRKYTDDVTVKVYIDGELDRSKTVVLDPSVTHKLFYFTGSGKVSVRFKVNNEAYAAYELDFDNSKVTKISSNDPSSASDHFEEMVPYDEQLVIECANGKLCFSRIATTPRVLVGRPRFDKDRPIIYEEKHEIISKLFQVMNGKEAVEERESLPTLLLLLYGQRDDEPWHYLFKIGVDGLVKVSNNEELICFVQISEDELQSIIQVLD